MDQNLFRKLNAGKKWSNYDEAALMVNEGKPSYADFKLETRSGRPVIVYDHPPWKLEVVREEERDQQLQKLYDDPKVGSGKGIRLFYDQVRSRFLNIPRAAVKDFLSRQVSYQLSRPTTTPTAKTKKYYREGVAVAIDLIDMSPNATASARYILTAVDLFSQRSWLRKIREKTADTVRDAFATFCPTTVRFVHCDNGGEFAGSWKQWCTQRGITVYHNQSHVPVGAIENLNLNVRKTLADLFIRRKSKAWISLLPTVEASLNARDTPARKLEREKERQVITPELEAKHQVGDHVRISLRSFQSDIRRRMKSSMAKNTTIYVKWSISVFTVARRYRPSNPGGLHSYALRYMHDPQDWVRNRDDNTVSRFKEQDLLHVPPPDEHVGDAMSEAAADRLNEER